MSLSYKLQVIHVITPAINGLVLLLILRCNWGELSHAATTLSGLGRQILHPPLRRTLDDVDGRSFPTSYTFYLDGGNFDKIELRHLIGWRFFFWASLISFSMKSSQSNLAENAPVEVWKSWARRSVLCRPSLFSSIWRQTLGWNCRSTWRTQGARDFSVK